MSGVIGARSVTKPQNQSRIPPSKKGWGDDSRLTLDALQPDNNTQLTQGFHMSIKHQLTAGAALLCLSMAGAAAFADDHTYTEGTVSEVSAIRTIDGHFDDYMNWIDTVWKKEQEAAKKAGYIVGYEVFVATPRTENDPDLYLMITYKNHAALDDWIVKGDTIAKQIEGSVAASNQAQADRGKIRRVLGSEIVQTLNLK
jgi:hypothetical protein